MKYHHIKHYKSYLKHLPKPSKKVILIIAAVIGFFSILFITLTVLLFVWIFNMFDSNDVSQVVDQAQGITQQVANNLNIQDFINNGVVNVDEIKKQAESLTPAELQNSIDQVNQLVENNQITTEQGQQILNIYQGVQ